MIRVEAFGPDGQPIEAVLELAPCAREETVRAAQATWRERGLADLEAAIQQNRVRFPASSLFANLHGACKR
jgi:hypothetical protein